MLNENHLDIVERTETKRSTCSFFNGISLSTPRSFILANICVFTGRADNPAADL